MRGCHRGRPRRPLAAFVGRRAILDFAGECGRCPDGRHRAAGQSVAAIGKGILQPALYLRRMDVQPKRSATQVVAGRPPSESRTSGNGWR
jgi:hypothetical protein